MVAQDAESKFQPFRAICLDNCVLQDFSPDDIVNLTSQDIVDLLTTRIELEENRPIPMKVFESLLVLSVHDLTLFSAEMHLKCST